MLTNLLTDNQGVGFDNSSFLNFSSDVDILSGSKSFLIFFRPNELTYGLFSKGRAHSGNSTNGDFSLFPFGANFRIGWQELETVHFVNFPNVAIDEYYLLRVTFDRLNSVAEIFVSEELVASESCSPVYTSGNTTRASYIGTYSNTATYNFNGSVLEIDQK